ncbi:adenine deaminase [Clostridia bacterium OttesenSCG-928-O13]|nr:adenine deaminase [Clostridia bacterium OttesenSCG-928-O13]
MRTLQDIKTLIRAGLKKEECDIALCNVKLVNVFSREVYPTTIYIKGKRVVSICPDADLPCRTRVDCGGQYALPGFIDSHMHFESTMLSPEALAAFVVEKGTTTLCADLMEIANVCGEEGIRCMLAGADRLPYRMLIEVSSRVPTAPGLETTGAIMDEVSVARLMQDEASISLGELDPSKILNEGEEYLKKVADTLAMRKIVNGHAIGKSGQDLNIYASSGISDDHECVERGEMLDRLRLGMKVLVREGSTERNLDELIQGVLDLGLATDNLCFCTDDKHVDEIKREGHINYNVNRAIQLGMEPMDAICMATVNAAKHFRLEDEIGSITPGRIADIILCESLSDIQPTCVYFEGKKVFEAGTLHFDAAPNTYPDWLYDTVHLKNPITAQSFLVPCTGTSARVNVIDLIDRQIINRWAVEELAVENGALVADVSRDILKIAVVERYGKNGNVGVGFVRGFTLGQGAVAYSMSHDHHNIVVIGTNDEDMAVCVNCVADMHGGLAAALNGEVTAQMPLPIGGLMSADPVEEVDRQLAAMNTAAAKLGCTLPAPFMTLSFISLPTVPQLGLTDMGLVDVDACKLIPLLADDANV